jgi:hypothetical protein
MKRFLLAPALALTMSLAAWSAPASPQPMMTCADGFEAICIVIGTACGALDTVDEKILKKNLIDCALG